MTVLLDETIEYNVAVREGKQILEHTDSGQLRLGELADKIQPIYGEKTLTKFAKAIGIAPCTAGRYRSVYRAWKSAPEPQCIPKFFSVAKELEAHPERFQIIRDNPNITKREARQQMRQWNGELANASAQVVVNDDGAVDPRYQVTNNHRELVTGNDYLEREMQRWFNQVYDHANTAVADAAFLGRRFTPDQIQAIRQAVEPRLLEKLRAGGRALIDIADWLDKLSFEQHQAAA
jgi:hypothetical protein